MKISSLLLIIAAVLASCNTIEKKSEKNTATHADSLYNEYLSQGRQVVSLSFRALSSQLQLAIGERGTDGALAFCSVHALPITDSLSQALMVNISRTALRIRNPENAPDPLDERIMHHFMQLNWQSGTMPDTLVMNELGEFTYMAPIPTFKACLQCHGIPEIEIKPQTINLIQSLYPDDKAIGFREGDLRGLWKVQFRKQNNLVR
jgi:hypothetical protein